MTGCSHSDDFSGVNISSSEKTSGYTSIRMSWPRKAASSCSRYHAEVKSTDRGWRVRDLGSTNGTRLNGVRLGNGQWPLRVRDLLQFGEVAVVVEAISEGAPEPDVT